MLYLYRISIWCYRVLIQLAAPFHPKARKFVSGRRHLFKKIETELTNRSSRLVWIHAASLGEFEQGRPLIANLKQNHPDIEVLVTFFSPSGYEVHHDNPDLDYVCYLPVDSPTSAARFLELVQPDLAIFIKYEFWYYYLVQLHRRSIPLIMVSAIFRPGQMFFHSLGRFYLKSFDAVTHFFVQDIDSKNLLNDAGYAHVTVAGDTRYDRVLEIATDSKEDMIVSRFVGSELVMVLGSVWPSDWKYLEPVVRQWQERMKIVVAPHIISPKDIEPFTQLEHSVKYSEASHALADDARILIIDNMGKLSSIYRYAHMAYVGGAFRGALHNVLEPAVYGVPVMIGKDSSNVKFIEAQGLVATGGAVEFADMQSFAECVQRLVYHPDIRQKMGEKAQKFVEEQTGATATIMKAIDLLL